MVASVKLAPGVMFVAFLRLSDEVCMGMGQPGSTLGVPKGLSGWLSKGWWVGVGVVLATAVALLGILHSSGSSPTYSTRGDCNAQGTNNVVSCSGGTSKSGP